MFLYGVNTHIMHVIHAILEVQVPVCLGCFSAMRLAHETSAACTGHSKAQCSSAGLLMHEQHVSSSHERQTQVNNEPSFEGNIQHNVAPGTGKITARTKSTPYANGGIQHQANPGRDKQKNRVPFL
jgi:hypothetical protein